MAEIEGSKSRKNNAFSIHICVQWEKTNFIFDIFCDIASPKLFQQKNNLFCSINNYQKFFGRAENFPFFHVSLVNKLLDQTKKSIFFVINENQLILYLILLFNFFLGTKTNLFLLL
jgi:hypothetical protein